MGVYLEVTRHLRTNPALLEEFQKRGGEELEQRVRRWFMDMYESGTLREDVSREDLVAFINIVANGAALARALDLELNADALVKLFHTGIDPPRQ